MSAACSLKHKPQDKNVTFLEIILVGLQSNLFFLNIYFVETAENPLENLHQAGVQVYCFGSCIYLCIRCIFCIIIQIGRVQKAEISHQWWVIVICSSQRALYRYTSESGKSTSLLLYFRLIKSMKASPESIFSIFYYAYQHWKNTIFSSFILQFSLDAGV